MILTHILDNTTRTAGDEGGINVGDVHVVPFTFENLGESDYQIYEVNCDKNFILLDDNDDVLSLPLNVPSNNEVEIKLKFSIENRSFLPLRVFVTTTEQGRTNHLIRISEKIVEFIEDETSELQVVGNVINIESAIDAGEKLTTKHDGGTDFNPYTVSFAVKNIGVKKLDIYDIAFVDNDLNKYDFITVTMDSQEPTIVENGKQIESGAVSTIYFNIDLSSLTSGAFNENLFPISSPEDINENGFDLNEIGSIYIRTNSLKSYYSPIHFSEENLTVNEGIFIIPMIGTIYISTGIRIISNTEGTYDTRQEDPISFENLILNTNRRTEQLIINNFGIDSFNITGISSNYLIDGQDGLSFYDGDTEQTFPLTIDGETTKYLDIRFDGIKMIDDHDQANKFDDYGHETSINNVFYKTLTITTDPNDSVFNVDENNNLNIKIPFSIFYNQYIYSGELGSEFNHPYDWAFSESRNRMSFKDSDGNFYSGATYEYPFGFGLYKLNPSQQKVTQLKIKNNDVSSGGTKYFKAEIVDNNKHWKNKPYLIQGGLNVSVNQDAPIYFRLNPGEITGTTVFGKDQDSAERYNNYPILCIVETNSWEDMTYDYYEEQFDEKYDLKKEGENIVVKVTEGSWVDEDNNPSDGSGDNDAFIPKETVDLTTGFSSEVSMVQYVVATWKRFTYKYYSEEKYINQELIKFFRPRDTSIYSLSNYRANEYLIFTEDIIPTKYFWSNSNYFANDNFSVGKFHLYYNENFYKSIGSIDFDFKKAGQDRYYYSINKYFISQEIPDFNVIIPEVTHNIYYYYNLNNFFIDNSEEIVSLEKGDPVEFPELNYQVREYWSNSYMLNTELITLNYGTHIYYSSVNSSIYG